MILVPFLKVIDALNQEKTVREKISLEKIFADEPHPEKRQLSIPGLQTEEEAPRNINKEKGNEYERYVGSLYENKKYIVVYNGIEKNACDLGRDLICKSHNYTVIVQCKYYECVKSVSIKDIYQFYGSIRHYATENPKEIVSGSFWTNLNMHKKNDKAFRAAIALGIIIHDGIDYKSEL